MWREERLFLPPMRSLGTLLMRSAFSNLIAMKRWDEEAIIT
jgi:hypothetical protein